MGRRLILLGPFGVLQVVVVVFHFFLHLLNFLGVFVENMLSDKVRPFELFARQRAQPLVFAELLCVGLKRDKELGIK